MGESRVDTQPIYCSGCGIQIQTEDKQKLGYAPASALQRDVVICQRCFKLKHYNEVQDVSLTDDDFYKILNTISEKDALVVKIVDVFDFNGSWLTGLNRFAGKNDVFLVGNKVDLLPKLINRNKVTNWLKFSAKQLGLTPKSVALMSTKTGEGVLDVAAEIDRLRGGRDVYIVGCTNVGKSSFINQLIKQFAGDTDQLITTSHFPGTTLDVIDIPLDDGQTMFDTPGIINRHQMAHYVSEAGLKVITPKKEAKPKVYQLNSGQTLFLGGLGRMDFVQGERTSFVCYVSNELSIHRTKYEKANQLYEQHAGTLLTPPDEQQGALEMVKHEFKITDQASDIVYSGLGWITVKGSGLKIEAYAPKGVGVSVRPSILSG
ncbi:ribosome biogenesis GTPase YqeH [Alkalicoccobacillus porphyridii]|uniref:ribosome biogenesis GTPase YqeH n=1 Tax=Alkalicoccobacillus porphyridii TaxID=2597270 RepID=UPI0021B14739|nr:ribosome biogenesis GTPase YqeH [Alkalicoccobacillus porphyridii]